MGSKRCANCGEEVDDAKAFCPGCGNAFVEEEERETLSGFDMSNDTIKLGDTLYNQLLSDMGLSISKAPNKGETIVESKPRDPSISPAVESVNTKPSSRKWLILGVVAVMAVLLLFLLVLVILILLWPRFA